jgi:GH25 family lysozyme M1 (1,4-beta-N-acetylmuramidase)
VVKHLNSGIFHDIIQKTEEFFEWSCVKRMDFRSLRIHKLAVYLSGITIIMCGFQGPAATTNFAHESYAKDSASIYSVSPAENSDVNSAVNSVINSSVSSAESSKEESSQASSSQAAEKPKAVVPTKEQLQAATKVIPTTAQKAAEDPEAIKAKSSVPIKNSVTISSSSTASKVASSAVSSSKSSTVSSAASSSKSSTVSSAVSSAISSATSSLVSSSTSSSLVPFTGWKTISGVKYFYYQNTPLTGWQTIEGNKYYFDSKGALKTRLGIDVSEYQGTIDWKKVKAAGIDFAIIRAGWRGYGGGSYNKDTYFEQNYNGAKAAGISVGIYFFSQAITVEEAAAEAQFTLDILNGRSLSEQIAIDMEYISDPNARTNLANLTDQQRTDIAKAYCNKIKSSGYTPMIYSGKYYFYNYLYVSQLSAYTTWVAQYLYDSPNEGTTYGNPYKYWQYTSSGKIDGISSSGLDMDISF